MQISVGRCLSVCAGSPRYLSLQIKVIVPTLISFTERLLGAIATLRFTVKIHRKLRTPLRQVPPHRITNTELGQLGKLNKYELSKNNSIIH
jgi:hypothetical protein